ncbi:T9SS type A sorting domain-containing protein [Winogradskyella maritima]|uniref:T9SS type A sorting domain-containing protein n=1 Tax=Winogradskyella maritima TaxID=1517766 RepID=A0ABV8AFU3_9FLAO|nr:T9SS type A sorting domain-containing protein [Winogradskyella maritima]
MKLKLLVATLLIFGMSYTQTFNWDSSSVNLANCNSGPSSGQLCTITETVMAVTCAFTAELNGNNSRVIFGPFNQGATGNGVSNADDDATVVITFNSPVDISTISAFTDTGSGSFEFRPISATSGSNTILNINNSASTQALNWTGVTRMEVTPELSGANRVIRLDDIAFTQPIVNIPDATFKANLVNNTNINTNGDTEIQVAEAVVFTGGIQINSQPVMDATGVEAFTNLSGFLCSGCQLTSIDVSGLLSLRFFDVGNNSIQYLDLSNNSMLVQVVVFNNGLLGLDVANGNNTDISIFSAEINPNLACINIDSGFTPPSSWRKDNASMYSDNCPPLPSLSINDFSSIHFRLYPNPTTSLLNIESLQDIKQVNVYSITGKVLKTIKNSKAIDVSDLMTGVYFVQITGKNGAVSKSKFLKK